MLFDATPAQKDSHSRLNNGTGILVKIAFTVISVASSIFSAWAIIKTYELVKMNIMLSQQLVLPKPQPAAQTLWDTEYMKVGFNYGMGFIGPYAILAIMCKITQLSFHAMAPGHMGIPVPLQ